MRSYSTKNSVLQLNINRAHRSSPPNEPQWFNRFEARFSNLSRLQSPRPPLLLQCLVQSRNRLKPRNLQAAVATDLVYRVFTMYCKREFIVEVATLQSNIIGDIAPFVALDFD